MKSIIIISTLLFVTASFMGIGSYIRYNKTLQENGLYAAPKKTHETTTAPETEIRETNMQSDEQIIEDKNEVTEVAVQQVEKKEVVKQQVRRKEKQERNNNVLHAAKKPKEREINFREFSRAPLEDYPEPTSVTEEITEAAPAVTVNNEENN